MRPKRVSIGIAATLLATAALAATLVGTKGTFTTTVTPAADNSKKDNIDITYTPDPTKVTCATIYLTQTCRDVDQNGDVIEPKSYQSDTYKHLQNDMTAGGTYVDHLVCEKDPYYNGEDAGKDTKSKGSSDGVTAEPTSMSDDPSTQDASFPVGVTKITSTFEVCAVCKEDGSILDCITWKWERTKLSPGKGTITDATAVGAATQEFKDAVKKYNENHKNSTVCPELEAEKNKGQPNVTPGTNKKTPNDPPVENTFSFVSWDIVNSSGVNVFNIQYIILLDGDFFESGSVPSIPYFDHVSINFQLPPLPQGPHALQMILDPGNSIPEYNEGDNQLHDLFVVMPPTGVGTPGGVVSFALDPVWPQPSREAFTARFALPSAAPATLELIDVRGRRVQAERIGNPVPGRQSMSFRMRDDLEPGVYLLTLVQDGRRATVKVGVVR